MSKTRAIKEIKRIKNFREIKRRTYNGNMETTFIFDIPTRGNILEMFKNCIVDNYDTYESICRLIPEILEKNNVEYKFVNQGLGMLQFGDGFGIEYTVDFPLNR